MPSVDSGAVGKYGVWVVRLLFTRGFAWLVLCSMIFTSNLHLPFVQAVAWTRMYHHYREGYAPQQALLITFSGKVPCELCLFVKKAQNEQHVVTGLLAGSQRELLPLTFANVFVAPAAPRRWAWREPATDTASWIVSPELPPPRGLESGV